MHRLANPGSYEVCTSTHLIDISLVNEMASLCLSMVIVLGRRWGRGRLREGGREEGGRREGGGR